MASRDGSDVNTALALIAGHSEADADKARVLAHIGAFVADGLAVWEIGGNGDIEVRFSSGETYLLAEATILRRA